MSPGRPFHQTMGRPGITGPARYLKSLVLLRGTAPGSRWPAAPFLRHEALAARSGREMTASSQGAGLSGDQAAFRARDPAGRLP